MRGITRFGIQRGCLENRFWARLVEKLALMTFQRDKENKELYHFYTNEMQYFCKIRLAEKVKKGYTSGGEFRLVEIFDYQGKKVLKEEISVLSIDSIEYSYHPLNELFGLVGLKEYEYGEPNQAAIKETIKTVKIINELLKG